jgi:hypothetical protein
MSNKTSLFRSLGRCLAVWALLAACSKGTDVGGESHVACKADSDCTALGDDLVCEREECKPSSTADAAVVQGSGGAQTDGSAGGPFGSDGVSGAPATGGSGAIGPNTGGSSGAPGTGGLGNGGSTASGVTESCGLRNTSYPGDELCILPPDPAIGFQVHYGPASYDSSAIQPFASRSAKFGAVRRLR